MSTMIRRLDARRRIKKFGGKAHGLLRLAEIGYDTPPTWMCSWQVGGKCLTGNTKTLKRLRRALEGLLDPLDVYAVRSSADVEDSASSSYAGLFESVLSLHGVDEVLDGMLRVWRSADSPRARAMLPDGSSENPIRMSVLIQPMIRAVSAGIAFSRNPVTGYEEVVVEAIEGTGDQLTQGNVTPVRWVLPPEAPLSEHEATLSTLPIEVLAEIAEKTREAAVAVGYPVDLEWAYDGTALIWLQMRPITSLSSLCVYSNKMSRQFLPGLIKPMVWSINVPMINGSWVRLFEEIVGPLDLDPKTLAKRFHHQAYFNMSGMGSLLGKLGFPKNTLEILLGLAPRHNGRSPIRLNYQLLRYVPSATRFMVGKLRFSRHVKAFIPAIRDQLQLLDDDATRYGSVW